MNEDQSRVLTEEELRQGRRTLAEETRRFIEHFDQYPELRQEAQNPSTQLKNPERLIERSDRTATINLTFKFSEIGEAIAAFRTLEAQTGFTQATEAITQLSEAIALLHPAMIVKKKPCTRSCKTCGYFVKSYNTQGMPTCNALHDLGAVDLNGETECQDWAKCPATLAIPLVEGSSVYEPQSELPYVGWRDLP